MVGVFVSNIVVFTSLMEEEVAVPKNTESEVDIASLDCSHLHFQ